MKRLVILVITTLTILFLANAADSQKKTTTTKSTTKTQAVVKQETTTPTVSEEKHYCIYITKADFIKKVSDIEKDPNNWKYLGNKPCIIDFYTTWCGPCRMLAPVLEELAKEYEGKLYIYKADAEKEKELALAFQVQAYPTLIFCPIKGGPQMAKGALPKAQLVEIIEQVLLKKQAPPPPTLLQRR